MQTPFFTWRLPHTVAKIIAWASITPHHLIHAICFHFHLRACGARSTQTYTPINKQKCNEQNSSMPHSMYRIACNTTRGLHTLQCREYVLQHLWRNTCCCTTNTSHSMLLFFSLFYVCVCTCSRAVRVASIYWNDWTQNICSYGMYNTHI